MCWHPFFPVEKHLRENMTAELWERFVSRVPKDKITTLLELIEDAKKRAQHKDE
jgi:hypothetical protein